MDFVNVIDIVHIRFLPYRMPKILCTTIAGLQMEIYSLSLKFADFGEKIMSLNADLEIKKIHLQ